MFQHILIPTDGSELSLRALDTGIELAAWLGSRIHAFHVIAPFPASTYFAEFVLANEPTYTQEATAIWRTLASAPRRLACPARSATNSMPVPTPRSSVPHASTTATWS